MASLVEIQSPNSTAKAINKPYQRTASGPNSKTMGPGDWNTAGVRGTALSIGSDAFGSLNLLDLLLLQHQHDLGDGHSSQEAKQAVEAHWVLKHNFSIHLAETAHVGIVGQGFTSVNAVANSHHQGGALTDDPNVGGFGQMDAEVVLQNPVRLYGLLGFLAAVAIAQIMLVLKKKQIEKVQAAEGV